MKQSKTDTIGLDLDQLERELISIHPGQHTADRSVRGPSGDDPLAELARIMRQDDPFSGLGTAQAKSSAIKATDFDDFLKLPPRAANQVQMREPSLDSFIERAPDVYAARDAEPEARSERVEVYRGKSFGQPVEPPLDNSREESMLSPDRSIPNFADDYLFDAVAAFPADNNPASDAAVATPVETVAQAAVPAQNANAPKPGFDDMLAEFEAAMRDVGGEKIAAERNSSVPAPSLEPIVIPPPPEELTAGMSRQSDGSGMMVAGAAGAAAMSAGAMAATSRDASERRRPRRGLIIAGGVIGVALIGVAGLLAFGGGSKQRSSANAPVIAAKPGVTKERPANPGGVDVPNQDKEVLQSRTAATAPSERVGPREEQPVDLRQAQSVAAGQPSVRQIPGVSIVAPITTTAPGSAPASPSVAGLNPVPRPVASVPISISGQPVVNPPVASPPVVPATPPVAVLPAASEPTPAPKPPQPAAAEPRRVRAVPIRTEAGETAPSRAQAQPRVVAAATRAVPAPEPDAANAPLRITPQALRGAQRVASAPAAPENGTLQATSSSGSGFTVQLAAEGSEDAARAKFSRVKSQYNQVLGSYNANIRSAEVNGRSVYRVRVGSFSREEAVSVCERLKASGGNCFVARN
ncbi:MAG: SPOR domain-containing protein [Beijerinckiaceae bacterium]